MDPRPRLAEKNGARQGEYFEPLKNKKIESVRCYILAAAQKACPMGICPMLWDPGILRD